MKRFKFFHGYNVTIDMFDMESFATASIAGPDSPYMSLEEVERILLRNHFERARMLAQDETDRIERRRVQIQAEIQSRLRAYGDRMDTIQRNIENHVERIRDWQDQPILGPTGTKWSRFKRKVVNYWDYHETEIYFGIACTFLVTMFGLACYLLIAKR